MGAAFEVNRQMCDIGRLISVEEMSERYNKQISQSRLDGLSAWLKLHDMEEKKTNKMTKAEAFKYLDEAKIYVDGQIEAVLEKLFEIGFTWRNGGQQVDLGWSRADEACGLIIHDGELCWVDKECCGSWFDNLYMPNEQRAEDVLSIEIVEGTPKFSYDKVVDLAKPLMEYLNDTGCSERICVTYESIVAEPMATFLHGQMKGC